MDPIKILTLLLCLLVSACGKHTSSSQFFEKSGVQQKPVESSDPFVLLQQAIFDDRLDQIIEILTSQKYSIDLVLKSERTLLAEASSLKKTKIMRYLVIQGANLEISLINGESLKNWIQLQPEKLKLSRALFKTEAEDQMDLLSVLVKNEFRPLKALLNEDINVNFISPEGSTPLIMAIENEWMNSLRVLFSDPKLDVNLADLNGESPLKVARKKNLKNIENELLKRFAKE